jgi:PAS domain S-box-containing protein
MKLALPHIARHIPPKLPLIVVAAFAVYSLVMLSYTVSSWRQMKRAADTYILADSERRAASVADLSDMARAKAAVHADLSEVHAFLLNRDLGMSMRYGLGASLQAIENRFRQHVKTDPPSLADRIVFLAEDGTRLVDTQPDAPLPLLPEATPERPGMLVDAARGLLVTAAQVDHKGAPGGVVVTIGSPRFLYRNLITGPDGSASDNDREILVTAAGQQLVNGAASLPIALLRALQQIPGDRVVSAEILGSAGVTQVNTDATLLVKTAVPGIPLYLVRLLPKERAYGHIAPGGVLAAFAVVLIVLLAGAIYLDRMRVAAEQMKADILASQQKRESAEQRNMELAAEIWRRETVEKALAASEERWELAIRGANDGIWDWNLQAGEVHFSERWKSMLGLAENDISNAYQEWESRIHPEDFQRVMAELSSHLDRKTAFYQCEYRLRHKQGHYIWLLDRGQALFDAEGHPVRMAGSHSDITERRAAEMQAQERLEQLHAIFELSPDGFVSFDIAGHVSYVNPAFLGMTRLQENEVMGLRESTFSHLLNRLCRTDSHFPGLDELGRTAQSANRRERLELSGAGQRVLEVGLRSSAAGLRVSKILYFHDVTSESEVDRMKSEFLSTAAHELRTPMASIYGYAEVLMAMEFGAEDRKTYLGRIFRQAELMVSIINELLDLARIEARRGKDFVFESVDMRELTQEAVTGFMPPEGRDPPVLDLTGSAVWVTVDRKKMQQAINNVLSNAYKYSPAGGAVEVDLLPGKGEGDLSGARIEVRDFGIGLTPAQIARVCERFFRADASGAIPGTGLGMSIVKEIMEFQNGQVHIASEPGAGARVSLWLPDSRSIRAVRPALDLNP